MEFHVTNNRRKIETKERRTKIDIFTLCSLPRTNTKLYSFCFFIEISDQQKLYDFIIFKWNNNGIEIVKANQKKRRRNKNDTQTHTHSHTTVS